MIIDKKRGMIKLLYCVATIAFMSMIVGCKDSVLESKLNTAELIIDEQPDSAFAILNDISIKSISNRSQKAKFALLLTMAQFKCEKYPNNDSIINIAYKYFKSGKYQIESIIFKGCVTEILDVPKDALHYYKEAETLVSLDNYDLLGYINMRIGNVYRHSYINNNEHINKYKKALFYYTKSNNVKYQQVCASTIGALYRASECDSAHYYLNKAIELSKIQHDSINIYKNLCSVVWLYNHEKRYLEGKNLALNIIQTGKKHLTNYDVFHYISRAYSRLGILDSARYYFRLIPTDNMSDKQKVAYLRTKDWIYTAENNYKEAYDASEESANLSYEMLVKVNQQELYQIEKRYDKTQAEKEKIEAQRNLAFALVALSLVAIVAIILFYLARIRQNKIIEAERTLEELNLMLNNGNLKLLLLEQERIDVEYKSEEQKKSYENRIKRLNNAFSSQIELIKNIITKSANNTNGKSFLNDFNELISTARLKKSTWTELRNFVDETNDNLISNLSERCPELTESELNFIGLMCCDFSITEIMICMGYTNMRSTTNRRQLIAKKLNIDIPLQQYLKDLMKK